MRPWPRRRVPAGRSSKHRPRRPAGRGPRGSRRRSARGPPRGPSRSRSGGRRSPRTATAAHDRAGRPDPRRSWGVFLRAMDEVVLRQRCFFPGCPALGSPLPACAPTDLAVESAQSSRATRSRQEHRSVPSLRLHHRRGPAAGDHQRRCQRLSVAAGKASAAACAPDPARARHSLPRWSAPQQSSGHRAAGAASCLSLPAPCRQLLHRPCPTTEMPATDWPAHRPREGSKHEEEEGGRGRRSVASLALTRPARCARVGPAP